MDKIIIDTDPGIDDALAIMLAVKSGKFDIKAITTVMGNSTIGNTTLNANYILDLIDGSDIPIYSGSEKPLKSNLTESFVMGSGGLGGINPSNLFSLTRNAPEKIIEIVNKNPNQVTIVAIGPLTNIARAIQLDPVVMKKVKKIVIMGGAIKTSGNQTRVAEFNIYNDPEAADIVFNFDIKKILIPLDLCNSIRLQLEDFNKISDLKIKEFISKTIAPYIERLELDCGIKAALMYDSLAIYYLLRTNFCKTNFYDIVIELNGEYTRGMTVADLRINSMKNNSIEVVEFLDEARFKEDFINILSKETLINKENLNKISKEETK